MGPCRRVLWLPSCPSTNDVAWAEGRARGLERLAVATDFQTAGRGRLGRSWISPDGKDLLFSVYLRPPKPLEPAGAVTALGAVAVYQALDASWPMTHGPRPAIRWPNDLYVGGRKLCGILAEGRTDGPAPDYVLGIGLNVNSSPPDWPAEIRDRATSLRVETGRAADRKGLLEKILAAFEFRYAQLIREGPEGLDRAWRQASGLPGTRVRLETGDGFVKGVDESVGLALGIALQTEGGERRTFQAEHVSRVEPL